MVRTYRVGRPEFPIADGRGAALTGGRWNSVGSAIIYTADTPVTAMLEAGVEHNRDLWSGGMLAEFSIPDEIIGRNILSRLIDDPKTRREVGDDWLRSGANCVLEVSSDQVSGGRLYLINPAHPDYHRITYSTSILAQGPVIRFPPGKAPSLSLAPSTIIGVQTWNGLVDQSGHPMRAGQAKLVRLEVGSINEALLAKVRASPDMLHALSPREFEEVVASFYEEQGWHVTLTPPSKDGGKDIIIVKKDEAGTRLCLVECKRWSPERPVGVEIVRQLYGVVERETATSGILVTTSRFTRGARQEEQALAHRMLLHDYTELTRLLGPPTGGLQ